MATLTLLLLAPELTILALIIGVVGILGLIGMYLFNHVIRGYNEAAGYNED